MTRQAQATRALAKVLSRLVLTRETILRHAHGVLRAPELIEVPGQASALALWLTVLDRARTEGAVEPLVHAVLDENPGAEALVQALNAWTASERATDADAPSRSLAEPSGEVSPNVARGARWWWLGLGALAGALLLAVGVRAIRGKAAGVEPAASAAQQQASALTPAPALSPLARAVEIRVLGVCWRRFVDGESPRPPTAVHIQFWPDARGQIENVRFLNLKEPDYDFFRSCVVTLATETYFKETWSATLEDVQVILHSP